MEKINEIILFLYGSNLLAIFIMFVAIAILIQSQIGKPSEKKK